MFSYVFMKVLETRPRSYDRRMDAASRGWVREVKDNVVAAVPAGAHVSEPQLTAGAGGHGAVVPAQDIECAATHGAQAAQPDGYRFQTLFSL